MSRGKRYIHLHCVIKKTRITNFTLLHFLVKWNPIASAKFSHVASGRMTGLVKHCCILISLTCHFQIKLSFANKLYMHINCSEVKGTMWIDKEWSSQMTGIKLILSSPKVEEELFSMVHIEIDIEIHSKVCRLVDQ